MEKLVLFLFVLSGIIVVSIVTYKGFKKGIVNDSMLMLYAILMFLLVTLEVFLLDSALKEIFVRITHIIAYLNI